MTSFPLLRNSMHAMNVIYLSEFLFKTISKLQALMPWDDDLDILIGRKEGEKIWKRFGLNVTKSFDDNLLLETGSSHAVGKQVLRTETENAEGTEPINDKSLIRTFKVTGDPKVPNSAGEGAVFLRKGHWNLDLLFKKYDTNSLVNR
jgi:hypothetical protein